MTSEFFRVAALSKKEDSMKQTMIKTRKQETHKKI